MTPGNISAFENKENVVVSKITEEDLKNAEDYKKSKLRERKDIDNMFKQEKYDFEDEEDNRRMRETRQANNKYIPKPHPLRSTILEEEIEMF